MVKIETTTELGTKLITPLIIGQEIIGELELNMYGKNVKLYAIKMGI